ncbi:T9SS type A sorting domain-containing protein [Polluticoccus soli]|uniref:T9SS type A sorting domain-containing protein n=1 Tax=Polluticoccus soli TaxID=3034150 RepID=UPI0023E3040A|nr:T9SS type A sorting domain-containing protein [Flavipsychrobacter sp. JY13-12]
MTRYTTLTLAFCFLFLPFMRAQKYQWVKGGGSSAAIQNRDEEVKHMCTDDNGNIYVLSEVGDHNIEADTFFMASAFNTSMNPIPHILFTSYTCGGTMRFAKLLEAKNSCQPKGIVYGNGKVYITGLMIGDSKRIGYDATFSPQYQTMFLAKFDTSGQYAWNKFVGDDVIANLTSTSTAAGALAIDGQGNIHQYNYIKSGLEIAPSVITTAGNYDIKYDVNGNLLSAIKLQLADTGFFVKKVEIDKQNNNIYALMALGGGSTTKSASYLVAYDPAGNILWLDSLKAYTGLANLRFKAEEGLYVIGGANPLKTFDLGGLTVTNTYPYGALSTISKVDPSDGSVKWIRQVNGSTGVNSLADIELLTGNKIAVSGIFNGKAKYKTDSIVSPPGGTTHPLFVIIDTAGNLVKLDQLHATGGYNSGSVMTKDNKNNVYIGGYTSTSITATGLTTPYFTNGSTDFFVVKYGYQCCTAPPVANFTAVVPNGKVGYFTYTGTSSYDSLKWNFGDGGMDTAKSPSHAYNVSDTFMVCVTVYSECGTDTKCQKVVITVGIDDLAMGAISIYPNPMNGLLTIEGAETGAKISLLNMLGQQVYNGVINSSKESINTANLPSGNYILHLTAASGERRSIKLTKE